MEIVSIDDSMVDQVVQRIVDASHGRTEPILSVRCPPKVAWDLSARLNKALIARDEPTIHRFEYDYQSGIAHIETVESILHFRVQNGLYQYIEVSLRRFVVTVQNAVIRQRIKGILNFGTSRISKEDRFLKQGGLAFGPILNKLPCLVGEVS